jgi:hypothetical protein
VTALVVVHSMKPRPPSRGRGSTTVDLQRARRLVLCVLLALGVCTLMTATMLLLHVLDVPGDGLVWMGTGQLAGRLTISAARSSHPGGGGSSSSRSAGSTHPLSKELDPDFVDAAAKAAATAGAKKCKPGCEQRGNCNAEEGRCGVIDQHIGCVILLNAVT